MSELDRICDRIKSLRLDKSISTKAFGEIVGISQAYVSMIEAGTRIPPTDTLKRICSALDTDIETICEGVDPADPFLLRKATSKKKRPPTVAFSFIQELLQEAPPNSTFTSFNVVLTGIDPDGKPFTVVQDLGKLHNWSSR